MTMEKDVFAKQPYGKAALKKLLPISENFRLYFCELLEDSDIMRVVGAQFRKSKSGKLSIMIKGTQRTVFVTKEEILSEKDIS